MQYHDLYVLPYNKKLYKAVLQINIYIFSSLNKKQNNNFGIRRLITSTSVRNSSKLSHTWQSARCVELLDWSDFTKANTCTKTPKSVREGACKVDPDFVSWKQLNTFLSNHGWKMKEASKRFHINTRLCWHEPPRHNLGMLPWVPPSHSSIDLPAPSLWKWVLK